MHIPTASEAAQYVSLEGGISRPKSYDSGIDTRATVSGRLGEEGWHVSLTRSGTANVEHVQFLDTSLSKSIHTYNGLMQAFPKTFSRKQIKISRAAGSTAVCVTFEFEGTASVTDNYEQVLERRKKLGHTLFKFILKCTVPFDFNMHNPNLWYFDGHKFVRMEPGSFKSDRTSFLIDDYQPGNFALSFNGVVPTKEGVFLSESQNQTQKVPAAERRDF